MNLKHHTPRRLLSTFPLEYPIVVSNDLLQAAKNCRMVEVTELEGQAIDDFRKCTEIKVLCKFFLFTCSALSDAVSIYSFQGYSYNWITEDMELQGGMCRYEGVPF